jgi:hypothetical protein
MRLVYYLPENETSDQLCEVFTQKRPGMKFCTDISKLRDRLVNMLHSEEESDAIVLVMCAHGEKDTGTVNRPQSESCTILEECDCWLTGCLLTGPLTAKDFSDGIPIPEGGTSTWPGLRAILQDVKNNKKTRFYFLAAQCYGLYFTCAMNMQGIDNASILGLSAGETFVEGTCMETKHMETEAHLIFIEEIESRYT